MTGGSPNTAGDSTELLVHGAAQWTRSGSLPSPRRGLRGASINNKVIVTGEKLCSLSYNIIINSGGYDASIHVDHLDDILQFEPESGEWLQIGTLKHKRSHHAVSVINFNSIKDFCVY